MLLTSQVALGLSPRLLILSLPHLLDGSISLCVVGAE